MRHRSSQSILLLAWIMAAGLACGQAPAQESKPDEPAKPAPDPGLAGIPAPVDPATFLIGPEDVLLVRVWREPELSGQLVVRPDGKITLPLAGEVKAAGLTPVDLTKSITEALAKFINRPEVFVLVQAVRSKKFLVSGEVYRPGTFPLATPVTVMEAIVQAGGLREFANKKKIVIIRGSERLRFNYNDVIKGKNLSQNIQVANGDHIVVP